MSIVDYNIVNCYQSSSELLPKSEAVRSEARSLVYSGLLWVTGLTRIIDQ